MATRDRAMLAGFAAVLMKLNNMDGHPYLALGWGIFMAWQIIAALRDETQRMKK